MRLHSNAAHSTMHGCVEPAHSAESRDAQSLAWADDVRREFVGGFDFGHCGSLFAGDAIESIALGHLVAAAAAGLLGRAFCGGFRLG